MSTYPYPIETGIPMPPKYAGRRRYPWQDLGVGQSFFVPVADLQELEALWYSLTSCRRNAEKHGKKFALRQTEVTGLFGIRAWRTK